MSELTKKMLKIANDASKAKIKQEKEELAKKHAQQKMTLEKIAKFIDSGLVYKEVGDNWKKSYQLVTEEILLADYTGEPASGYNSRTFIGKENDSNNTVVIVNGFKYFHIGDLVENHLKNIKNAIDKTHSEIDLLNRKYDALQRLKAEEPKMKKMLENYNLFLEEYK